MIEQTRFLSTVFLCSEFKLENYLLWSKFLQEKCFRWCLFAGKKSQKLEPAKISCHTVVRNRPLYIGTLSLALLVGVWSICCSFCCCFCVCVWVGGGKEGWGRCIQIVGAALREVSSEGLGIGREGKRTSLLPPSIPLSSTFFTLYSPFLFTFPYMNTGTGYTEKYIAVRLWLWLFWLYFSHLFTFI